jgi:hypothetical protein
MPLASDAKPEPRCRARAARHALVIAGALALAGCAGSPGPAAEPPPAPPAEPSAEVYRRADAARLRLLEQEVERLNADLRSAEETLVAVESGLRGAQTRTEAVSRIAEARIAVERAARHTPWQASAVSEANEKLAEAERQLADDRVGSALFFASRAERIAKTLVAEADRVGRTQGTRFVRGGRVNLRRQPTTDSAVVTVLAGDVPVFPEGDAGEWVLVRTVAGDVGWVHASLLRAP